MEVDITYLVILFQPTPEEIIIKSHHFFRVKNWTVVTIKSVSLKVTFLEMNERVHERFEKSI